MQQQPRLCVYTTLIGNYEKLNEQPIALTSKIPFICLTDNKDLISDSWQIKTVTPLLPQDSVRSQRSIKMRPHLHLPEYDCTLYIDNSVLLAEKPETIFQDFFAMNARCAISKHSWHNTLLDEFVAVLRDRLDSSVRVLQQLNHYEKMSPDILDEPAYWTGMLLRDHRDQGVQRMMEIWHTHMLRYARRDQLSINWAIHESQVKTHLLDINNNKSTYHTWPHINQRMTQKRIKLNMLPKTPNCLKRRRKENAKKQLQIDKVKFGKIKAYFYYITAISPLLMYLRIVLSAWKQSYVKKN